MRPAVSVIVPTFNRPRLLARTLASVAANTFDDLEIVVVNDAGIEVTGVVAAFEQGLEDPVEVRLVTHDRNRGATAAQRTGMALARGEHVVLLADDDCHLPHHLATLQEARAGRDVVVYSDGYQVMEDQDGNELERNMLPAPAVFDRSELLVTNFIPACCLLVPRVAVEEVGGFDEDLPVLEDWDLWLRLSAVLPFEHVPVPTVEYRIRGGIDNLTSRDWFRFQGALERVYAKHPVSDPLLRRRRAALLAGTSPRQEMQLFDISVVLISGGRPDLLVAALERVAAEFRGRSYEVIVHLPSNPATRALFEAIDGDITFVFGDGVSVEEAEAIGARRASGRRVVTWRDADIVDLPSGAALVV